MRRSLPLGLLVVAALATNAFAGAEARLTGTISDSVSKKPLADATILVESAKGAGRTFKQEFKADAKGYYAIFLLDGTMRYNFTYSAPGHTPFLDTFRLELGKPNSKDVELAPVAAAAAAAAPPKVIVDPALVAYNEGAVLANDGKPAEAIAKMEEAVTTRPDLAAGFQALARLYLRQKDYPKAIDRAGKALAIDSDDADMNAVMYEAYTATGDKAKAAEYKAKMPANPTALFNDAAKLINAGKDGQAEPLLKQAIAADEKFGPAYYELGMIYVRAGKNADAKANLQKYIEIAPDGKDIATAKEMLKYVK